MAAGTKNKQSSCSTLL